MLPRSPSLTPSWLPCALCGGGGVSVDWTVALPEDWHGRLFPTHHEPPHVPKDYRENVRETLVEFPSLHLHCGAQPHRQRFALRCTSQVSHRSMAPVATKAWRGQPLRAGRT